MIASLEKMARTKYNQNTMLKKQRQDNQNKCNVGSRAGLQSQNTGELFKNGEEK